MQCLTDPVALAPAVSRHRQAVHGNSFPTPNAYRSCPLRWSRAKRVDLVIPFLVFSIRASRKRKRLAGKSVVRVRRRSTFGAVLPRKEKQKKKAEMRVDLTAHANSKIEKSNEHQRTLEKKERRASCRYPSSPISLQALAQLNRLVGASFGVVPGSKQTSLLGQ
jgi:hypothetical protein